MKQNVKAKWYSIALGMVYIGMRYGELSNSDADESMVKVARAMLRMREVGDDTKDRRYVSRILASVMKGTYAEYGWLCMEVGDLFIRACPLEIRASLREAFIAITTREVTWHFRNGRPEVFARLWEYVRIAQWVSEEDIVTAPYRDEIERILQEKM
jgi:hypothetical protein